MFKEIVADRGDRWGMWALMAALVLYFVVGGFVLDRTVRVQRVHREAPTLGATVKAGQLASSTVRG